MRAESWQYKFWHRKIYISHISKKNLNVPLPADAAHTCNIDPHTLYFSAHQKMLRENLANKILPIRCCWPIILNCSSATTQSPLGFGCLRERFCGTNVLLGPLVLAIGNVLALYSSLRSLQLCNFLISFLVSERTLVTCSHFPIVKWPLLMFGGMSLWDPVCVSYDFPFQFFWGQMGNVSFLKYLQNKHSID